MADHDPSDRAAYVGIGAVASALGVSRESVRNFERRGLLPPAERVEPGTRRIWRVADIEAIRAQVEQQRAKRGDRVPAA